MTGDALRKLEQLACESHADAIAAEACSLAERTGEDRFYVACVGQFKRGKSTLLNALVGTEILPTGVIPVTSVPTVLRYGEPTARVRRAGAGWAAIDPAHLAEFVSEERNPGNQKGVLAVEAFVPSPLLASGLCFVDTPGLGSVFEANTAATREFVPHIDAALVVLGADPPLSGEELALVKEIARDVDCFVFVLNKADRVSERERAEAAAFAQRVLSERLGRPVERVFHISALDSLVSSGAFDWDALVQHLQALAQRSGRSLVAAAVRRGAARLGARLQHVLAEEVAALQRPAAESEQRLQALWAAADDASRALRELGPLFAAEEQRIAQTFAARRAAFIRQALPEEDAVLIRAIRAGGERSGPALRRHAYQLAQQVARERVVPWLSESERLADEAYQSAAARFTELASGLVARLHSSDVWASAPLPPALPEDEGLHAERHFYFHEFHHLASPAGLAPVAQWLADILFPRGMVLRHVERGGRDYLHRLLETNAARVENDLKQRLHESRQRLEREIRSVLAEVIDGAERAMERARITQAEGEEAVRAALARLESLQTRLTSLLAQNEPPTAMVDGEDSPWKEVGMRFDPGARSLPG